MAYNEELADRIRVALAREAGVAERKMFGGIGFMLDGNMVAGASSTGDLMVRVGPEAHAEAAARPGARIFEMTGRPMKGWLLVSIEAVADDDRLRSWLDEAIAVARSLPKKASSGVGTQRRRIAQH